MKQWTWLEIKTKVQNDLDLIAEDFISEAELLDYANEAIDECEAEIHTIYEDYFMTQATLSVVQGTQEIDVPSDIYADKIRKIFTPTIGSREAYDVMRIRNLREIPRIQAEEDYRYVLVNNLDNGATSIRIYPTPRESFTADIWYLRNAKRLAVDADQCDIPEFVLYVLQFMKQRCYEKEGHPNVMKAMQDTARLKEKMRGVLANRVDDDDNKIIPDLSFYYDYDQDWYSNWA